MRHYLSRNYRIISVMFWSFPYLLWQAFGHWSGFLVGVIVAVILTAMLNGLFHVGNWNTASSAGRQYLQTAGPQLYQAEARQLEYEEMEVPYPQMSPMEQW